MTLFRSFLRTLAPLFVFIFFGLWIDSVAVSHLWEHNQYLANIVMGVGFFWLYFRSSPRLKLMMVFSVIIAIIGECFFSLLLEMYTYRHDNVPFYVPPGHAIVFAAVYLFCREAAVKRLRPQLERLFIALIVLYSLVFLLMFNDVFGFVLTVMTLWILRKKPRERLFYLVMYLVVAYLEIIGTQFQCWVWPQYAFRVFEFLPSANPPAGISFFYFGLDLGALYFYKRCRPIAWARMKRIRRLSS